MRALYPRQQCSINLSQPCIHPRLSLQPPWATHKPILLQEMHVCQHMQCSRCMHSSLKPCTPADECCNLRQRAKALPPPPSFAIPQLHYAKPHCTKTQTCTFCMETKQGTGSCACPLATGTRCWGHAEGQGLATATVPQPGQVGEGCGQP